jgi:hypothetical protein
MSLVCFQFLVGSQDTVRHFIHPQTAHLTELADLGWFTGDVIAGLTVGLVVVPQSMSYAQVDAPTNVLSCRLTIRSR